VELPQDRSKVMSMRRGGSGGDKQLISKGRGLLLSETGIKKLPLD
jgi:hypothetical protein